MRKCPRCGVEKDACEFYKKRGVAGASAYCKLCTNEQTLERQRALKRLAVDYKGGCCERCGYSRYLGALEFHHRDPSEKEFTIGSVKNKSISDEIKSELDKCMLVCANCHRELHGIAKGLLAP